MDEEVIVEDWDILGDALPRNSDELPTQCPTSDRNFRKPAIEPLRDPLAEALLAEAMAIVIQDRKASTSYLQRKLSIGYNRATDIIDRLEAEGVIGPPDDAGRRDILIEA